MDFKQKISEAYRNYAQKKAGRKLVRQMERELPDMMADLEKMTADIARVETSMGDVMAEAAKLYAARLAATHSIAELMQPRKAPQVETPAPPPSFDPYECTILQNPMNVPRSRIRITKPAVMA